MIGCSSSPRRPPPPPIPSQRGAAEDPSTTEIPKSAPRDKGLLPSTTLPPSNNGSKDDHDEISPFLMDEQ